MKSNLKDIIESIPDFEDFMQLASEIGELSLRKMTLENQIKEGESNTFKTAMNTMLIDGKKPSASYIAFAYQHTGLNGELVTMRAELAYVQSQLDKKRIQLSIYRDMLEVFRTVSANERSVAI